MLAAWPQLGLCSGLERECVMTGEGLSGGWPEEPHTHTRTHTHTHTLMASGQNKVDGGAGRDFSHTNPATLWTLCFVKCRHY